MTDDQAEVPTIEIHDLTRKFGELVAVDGANFTVYRGEIFGLIGPNGAGKSTLIKMLATLLPPTSGAATIVGYDVIHEPAAVRRHIGYVPQLLSARLYGVPRHERASRIARALARMGLSNEANAGSLARLHRGELRSVSTRDAAARDGSRP